MFLSPTLSHKDLERCLQYTSLWCIKVLISLFSSMMRRRFCLYPFSTNSSSSYFFTLNWIRVLPKTARLHATRSDQHFFYFLKKLLHGTTRSNWLGPWVSNYLLTLWMIRPPLFKPVQLVSLSRNRSRDQVRVQ